MNLTFIGMSGAGKSTIGKAVASKTRLGFYDVDREMEQMYGKPMQEILSELGDTAFLEAQANQVIGLGDIDEFVISPGGSVVYTAAAMEFLKQCSTIVYIKVSVETAKARLDITGRGIVGLKDKTFEMLFAEREQLYEQYADVVIDAENKTVDALVVEVLERVGI